MAHIMNEGLDEVRSLVDYAVGHGLEGAELLTRRSLEEIASVYNGIGPDSWPSWLRSVADCVFAEFRAAALIHDCQFAWLKDRSRAGFNLANSVLRRNLLRISDIEHGWYSPLRYRRRRQGRRIADACCAFGWPAWLAAGESLTADEELAEMRDGE